MHLWNDSNIIDAVFSRRASQKFEFELNEIEKMSLGIGDDLFEAFFADDEPTPTAQKKKPTTAAPEVAVPAKAATKKTTKRKSNIKKTQATKKTTVAPPKPTESAEKEEEKPQFQHTPALLELAQQNTDEKAPTAEKSDANVTDVKVSGVVICVKM